MKSKLKTILIFVFQQIHFVFGQFLTAVLASQIVSSMILDGIWIKVKRMSSNISFRTDFLKVYEKVCLVQDFWRIGQNWQQASPLLYLWWATSINKTTSFTFLALGKRSPPCRDFFPVNFLAGRLPWWGGGGYPPLPWLKNLLKIGPKTVFFRQKTPFLAKKFQAACRDGGRGYPPLPWFFFR